VTVVIVDYGSGNLRSAAKAFERVVAETGLSTTIRVSAAASDVAQATHIVLPGVGAFADCRSGLFALGGMVDALHEAVIERGRPFLGICVGMQLLATVGHEHGVHAGLDWLPGKVTRINGHIDQIKVPHMGWNELLVRAIDHPVLDGIQAGSHAYFVHSYALFPDDPGHNLATVDYGGKITAVVGKDNIVGTQFHPEKSQHVGLALIANFLRWRP
jgi:glutamine amidotransferase